MRWHRWETICEVARVTHSVHFSLYIYEVHVRILLLQWPIGSTRLRYPSLDCCLFVLFFSISRFSLFHGVFVVLFIALLFLLRGALAPFRFFISRIRVHIDGWLCLRTDYTFCYVRFCFLITCLVPTPWCTDPQVCKSVRLLVCVITRCVLSCVCALYCHAHVVCVLCFP